MVNFFSLILGTMGLLIWALAVNSYTPSIHLLSLILGWAIAIITAVPMAGLFGFITTKFRDFGQLTILGFQMIWYLSPVFISESAFAGRKIFGKFMEINPVFNYLRIFRDPILLNQWPTISNLTLALIPAAILWPLFVWRLRSAESNLIYYI